MKFLDLNGLKHLLKSMDRTVIVDASKIQADSRANRNIPFITNHQIVNMSSPGNINLFNWFKGASEGGILEVVFAGANFGVTFCIDSTNESMIYKMVKENHSVTLNRVNCVATDYNTYARLIKLNGKLIVAEFVQNQ